MYDSKLKVTLSLIVDVESTIYPKKLNKKGLTALVVDIVADTIAQWNDEDLESNIDSIEVLDSKLDE